MSDKKQPAQQRVNVRIVKADDPEQRGGMKPIAKADGSLQISPEEAYTAGIWTKPPFDLRGLSKMVDESTILPQCIRAYKSNIAGFGIDIRYKDDFADADETPEMKAEWDRATEVVEMLNMEQESNELFEDIVEARETYGCAYAEVIRDMDGNVIQLEFIEDTPSVEKSRRLDPRVEVTYFHRDHTENRMRKFRKYKQTVNGKTVYYKEFGDPRIMDPTSGEYVTELEFKSRANEIIEFAIGTATYGKVRWVGSILTVDGARRAESLNNNYFLNGRHTPLLIMVKGGSLTDDSFAKLKEYMNGIRGEAGQHSFMVLETEAADNRTGFNAENRPEVEVKDLAAILQKDELFQDYLENNRRKVQSAFQLPDLYTGYTTDFNRATAQTAMEVTEKQVFQPERRRLAWAINNRLLNCYQFKYVEVFFRAPDGIDLRQGSIFYDAVAGIAFKIAKYYADLEQVFEMVFLVTATGDYLTLKAEEYAVYRQAAATAKYRIKYDGELPELGTRFFCSGQYFVLAQDDALGIYIEAEKAGTEANDIPAGTSVVPTDTQRSLTACSIVEELEPGADDEDDESLRKRVQEKIAGPAENGNQQHYKTWCESISGVGRARIVPLWAGENTVKGVLIDTEGGPASEAVVQRVQEYIDPGGTGLGEGQANIGAHFTATSATAKRVNISFSVTLAKGGDLASVRSAAQTALKAQIKSINLTTDDSETPTLRISTVGNTIYSLLGVLDYANLRFNGQTANVEAGKEEVFVLGEVTVSETNPVS